MKIRVLLLLTGLFFGVAFAAAQDVPQGAIDAFKQGNAETLGIYLGEKVEMMVGSKPNHADKEGAKETLAAFFATHKVGGFSVNHQGKRNESSFIVGTLTTENGNFRVNCFFKKVGNNYVIHQIRIEKTDE